MEAVVLTVITQIVGIALAAMCGWLSSQLKKNTAHNDAMRKGMKTVLRKDIVDAYEKHVTEGKPMSVERRHEIEETFRAYEALGGNGTGRQMYEELNNLPITIIR